MTAKELPDGTLPPPDADGNFIVGPTHNPAPETVVQDGVPQGTVYNLTMNSTDSKIYPGIARDAGTFGTPDPNDPAKLIVTTSHPAPYTRKVAVYVPKQYVAGHGRALHRRRRRAGPTPVHDARQPDRPEARARRWSRSRSATAAATRRAASAASSTTRCPAATPSSSRPRCCRSSKQQCNVKLTKDPEARATMGGSSGGCGGAHHGLVSPGALPPRPHLLGHVRQPAVAAEPETPHGAWEFHETSDPEQPREADSHLDATSAIATCSTRTSMRDDMHDWVVANENMAKVLAAKGYHYQFVFVSNAGHTERIVKQQTLPAALEYVWKTYPVDTTAH